MKLLEFLYDVLGCEYMSDLHFEPFRSKALLLLDVIDLREFSLEDIAHAEKYICSLK